MPSHSCRNRHLLLTLLLLHAHLLRNRPAGSACCKQVDCLGNIQSAKGITDVGQFRHAAVHAPPQKPCWQKLLKLHWEPSGSDLQALLGAVASDSMSTSRQATAMPAQTTAAPARKQQQDGQTSGEVRTVSTEGNGLPEKRTAWCAHVYSVAGCCKTLRKEC
jgi:hypothetical protein